MVAALAALFGPHTLAQSVGPPPTAPAATGAPSDPTRTARPSSPLEQRPLGGSAPAADDAAGDDPAPARVGSVGRTIAALAVVIVAIFVARLIIRAISRGAGGLASQLGPAGRAPSGVLSVLARYPVARGQSLVLLRMDQRVLLLSQSTAGFQPLAEITEPEEVASLLTRTRDEEGASLAARFTSMLRRMERDADLGHRAGLLGETPTTVAQALRLFPETRPSSAGARRRSGIPERGADEITAQTRTGAEALAAIRQRLADLEEVAS